VIVRLETGEEAQIEIHNISDGDPAYDSDTPGEYTFTADFNLSGVNYTNPNNFFVTFIVTTSFGKAETPGCKGGPSDSSHEDDSGDTEEDSEGEIKVVVEDKDDRDKTTKATTSTVTKKGMLPKTATENYNLIALG